MWSLNHGQIIKNGSHTTTAQLPVFNEHFTLLELKRTRFLCHECGATFHAQTELIEEHHHLSKQLQYQIMLDLKKNISRKMIVQKHFVSDITVLRMMERLSKNYQTNWNFLPKILCIDEFKSMKSCQGSMSFTREARLHVAYLVTDMNASYHQLLRTVFPNAQLVTDRFHIVQQMNRTLNQLRIQTMNRLKSSNPKQYRRLKLYWKLLLKDSDKLYINCRAYQPLFKRPLSQQDIVDELLHYDDVLRIGYDTIQYLKYAFSHREHTLFFEYLQQLHNQLPHWFKKKLLFFNKCKEGIKNSFRFPYSNDVTEVLNNKLKVIKRVAYGYRNFYHFRSRIYIIQGLIFSQQ